MYEHGCQLTDIWSNCPYPDIRCKDCINYKKKKK